jgi:uncharacterized membrane protein YdjX (TVP38/TMEM64 family)
VLGLLGTTLSALMVFFVYRKSLLSKNPVKAESASLISLCGPHRLI